MPAARDPWKLLIPIADLPEGLVPGTFVVLDIAGTDGRVYPQIGHFRGWQIEDRQKSGLLENRQGEVWAWPVRDIKKAYYAPVGLQLEWLEGRPVGGQ